MTNILTDAEAASALGRGSNDATKSSLLAIAVAAVTSALEDGCGPVVYGTITSEKHDGGGNLIYLDYRPVASITQVVEYDNTSASTLTAESNTSKPTAGYFLEPTSGALIRRNQNADDRFPVGRDNVVVSYIAGRFATQGSITNKFKQAAVMTLKSNWRAFESSVAQVGEFEIPQATFPAFMVPNIAKQILGKDWQSGSGVGE